MMVVAGALMVGVVSVAALVVLGRVQSASGSRSSGLPPAGRTSPRPKPPPPQRPPVGTIGSYVVASRSILFVDRSNPALGARELPTLIRYPVVPAQEVASGRYARGPFPLVVFAPGYMQCRSSYASLLNAWASAGYVVAAVQFPLTNCHLARPAESDLVNQPADVTTVINKLLAISAGSGRVLSGLIDPTKVAVAGHSDGGDTVAAVAANTCCRDYRVKAAIILSGAELGAYGGQYFSSSPPPMLFVQGTADTWNPPAASLQLYQSDTTGVRDYLDLIGADHFAPYEGYSQPEPIVARVTVDFLNTYLDGQTAKAGQIAANGDVPGLALLDSNGQIPG